MNPRCLASSTRSTSGAPDRSVAGRSTTSTERSAAWRRWSCCAAASSARGWMTDHHALVRRGLAADAGHEHPGLLRGAGLAAADWRGTLAALAAASVPASLLICVAAARRSRIDQYPLVRASSGIALSSRLLVLSTAWNLLSPYLQGRPMAVRVGHHCCHRRCTGADERDAGSILLVAASLASSMASPAARP